MSFTLVLLSHCSITPAGSGKVVKGVNMVTIQHTQYTKQNEVI